jgi:hypothetical protein
MVIAQLGLSLVSYNYRRLVLSKFAFLNRWQDGRLLSMHHRSHEFAAQLIEAKGQGMSQIKLLIDEQSKVRVRPT